MTPLELGILRQYYISPVDPENIGNPLHQDICKQFCTDDVLRAIEDHEVCRHDGYARPRFEITEKGRIYFEGIMKAVSRVPLPVYVILDEKEE